MSIHVTERGWDAMVFNFTLSPQGGSHFHVPECSFLFLLPKLFNIGNLERINEKLETFKRFSL